MSRRHQKRAEAAKATEGSGSGFGGLLLIGVLLLLAVGVYFMVRPAESDDDQKSGSNKRPAVIAEEEPSDAQREDWERFEGETMKAAREFLAESDPTQRLKLARDAEEVADHFDAYSAEVLSMNAKDVRKLGLKTLDGRRMASFAATLENDSMRLLNVVEEAGRLLMDWDSYARYGTMGWDALLGAGGIDAEAVVRVFVQPGDYYNPPFDDPRVWTSFRLVSPDVDRPLYAFAKADDPIAAKMRGLVMQNGNFRQHMTLRIKRHARPHDDTLFSVEELVAVGWVVL